VPKLERDLRKEKTEMVVERITAALENPVFRAGISELSAAFNAKLRELINGAPAGSWSVWTNASSTP
jgi:hypothetical protein